ncbi:MAG: hypothetical protein SGPRY_012971 [Prymnesium sp.]
MGGDDFTRWFEAVGSGAGIQNFFSYGNGPHIAPQLESFGRERVFLSTGIPCGCCGYDAPSFLPMNSSLATWYIDETLRQLGTHYADLLLMHHRCATREEDLAVWTAFETAKRMGKAHHLGVSNFNAGELSSLISSLPPRSEPIEVLEAHFGAGVMDFEALRFARDHHIHPVGFASLSMKATDLPGLKPLVTDLAHAHGVSDSQILYAYLYHHNITVLSSCFHPDELDRCTAYYKQDIALFEIQLSSREMAMLDNLTAGRRTCTDCFTDECQACARQLYDLGCPLGKAAGQPSVFPVWGRGNKQGVECVACAELPEHREKVERACGSTERGESLETMVPKACGI